MVMAPEHPMIDKYSDRISNMDAISAYRNECAKKTEFERTQLVKDKTGVKIDGLVAINPVDGRDSHLCCGLRNDGLRNGRNHGCSGT